METSARKPRLLWANRYCLFDRSSGASLSAREMLKQLTKRGFEVKIVGATVFDSENGRKQVDDMVKGGISEKKIIRLKDIELEHNLVCTKSHASKEMTFDELGRLYNLYEETLQDFKPDIVWMYGGQFFDRIILEKAKTSGAKTAFYLVNANYKGQKWHEHVDRIFTDTHATAGLYKERLGIEVTPIGKFIDKTAFVAQSHSRKNVTFVNPKPSKGAFIVGQIALQLEEKRPDIKFEIVESRGNWNSIIESLTKEDEREREILDNVIVTPNTKDMRPIYGRSRLVLAPSLWWESGSRVLAEALLNGIPAIVSNNGGSPEAVGRGGIKVEFPKAMYKAPYNKKLPASALEKLAGLIERFYDDEIFYDALVLGAKTHAAEKYNINKNSDALAVRMMELLSLKT